LGFDPFQEEAEGEAGENGENGGESS
jgi:hypothetical protein